MLDMISSQQGFKHGNLLLGRRKLGSSTVLHRVGAVVFLDPSIHVSFSAYKLLLPCGPRWLLELQPSDSHSNQQGKGSEKEGYVPPLRTLSGSIQ